MVKIPFKIDDLKIKIQGFWVCSIGRAFPIHQCERAVVAGYKQIAPGQMSGYTHLVGEPKTLLVGHVPQEHDEQ